MAGSIDFCVPQRAPAFARVANRISWRQTITYPFVFDWWVMRVLLPLMAVLLLPRTAAAAQEGPVPPDAAPLRIVIPIVAPRCDTPPPADGVIIVCGRKDDRYRIDPTVLAAIRSRDSRGGPRPDAHTTMFSERCSPVGLSSCSGQNVVPVTSILMVVATAVSKVVRGEDLRPMLHTVPDEYELYKQARATEEARGAAAPK